MGAAVGRRRRRRFDELEDVGRLQGQVGVAVEGVVAVVAVVVAGVFHVVRRHVVVLELRLVDLYVPHRNDKVGERWRHKFLERQLGDWTSNPKTR